MLSSYGRRIALLVTAVSVVALTAGCSTVHGVGAPKRTVGASTTTSAPSTHAGPNDKSIINQVVLRQSDLPGDWTAGATAPDDQSHDPQMSRCLGVPNSDPHKTAYAGSPRFQQGVVEISSQASIFDSARVVQYDARGVHSPNLVRCQEQELVQAVHGVSHVRMYTAAPSPAARGFGAFRIRGSAQVTENGTPTTLYLDEVGLAEGRIEVGVTIVSVTLAEPTGLMDQAVAAVARRLAAAAG